MRLCTTFWPLPNETFIEGSLDMHTFRSCHVVRKEQFVLFHNGTKALAKRSRLFTIHDTTLYILVE